MKLPQPNNVQNKAVKPSWGQLWREIKCAVRGHVFYVAWGNGYKGLPQNHCYRCGVNYQHRHRPDDWIEPIG